MRAETKKHVRKIIVASAFTLVLLAVLAVGAQSMVDSKKYALALLAEIHEKTGVEAKIERASFSLLPSPKLVFTGLALEDANAPTAPKFFVDKIEVRVALLSIFSKQIELSSATLTHPLLVISRMDENNLDMGWMNAKLLQNLSSVSAALPALPLSIAAGEIRYKDNFHPQNITLESLRAAGVLGAKWAASGAFKIGEQVFSFNLDNKVSDIKSSAKETPINLLVRADDKNTLQINSLLAAADGGVKLSGKFSAASDDIENWLQDKKPEQKTEQNTGQKTPVELAGDFDFAAGVIAIKKLAIKGLNSEGSGDAEIRFEHWYPTIALNLDFATLDYGRWKELLQNRIAPPRTAANDKAGAAQNYDFRRENPLPQNLLVKLRATTKKLLTPSGQTLENASLDAALDNGALTINQCYMDFADSGLLSLFGVVSQGGTGELRFEGNMEVKGKSLKNAIASFAGSANDLPEIGMGEFSANGNLYIDAKLMRFFEANATLEGANFSGEFTKYMDDEPRIDAKIKVKDVNFDYIRDALRKKKIASVFDIAFSFEWLKNLDTRLDAKIYADGFSFLEQHGETASFAVYAYNGDFRLYDLKMKYADSTADGSFILNVKGTQPSIKLVFNADQLDTRYFTLGAAPAQSNSKELSAEPIYLGWMEGMSATIDLGLRRFIHKNIMLDKVKLQAKLEDRKLTVQKLDFLYSQAQTNIAGTLYGGKAPGMAVNFTMLNADLFEFLNSLAGISNVSGYSSLSGTLTTSGLSYRDWFKNLSANLLLAAKGVRVRGINIDGVSNVVTVARSAADVVNNVKNVLTNGTTEFSIDGSLRIEKGEMKTPSLAVKTGEVTGNFVGGIDLTSLAMQASTNFAFYNLAKDTPPNMILQVSGKLDNPKIEPDTSALEAFVAKRKVGK